MKNTVFLSICERCNKNKPCFEFKFHGCTMMLCQKCGLKAIKSGEAVD